MHTGEPRVRRRGFFLHSDTTGERETGELENPEGFVVRVGMARVGAHHPGAVAFGESVVAHVADDIWDQPFRGVYDATSGRGCV